MESMTSKEREAEKQLTVVEPYRHPPAIRGHVYMITRGVLRGGRYYAVMDSMVDEVRLYCVNGGVVRCNKSAFGYSMDQWKDITDKVYLNTDDLEE